MEKINANRIVSSCGIDCAEWNAYKAMQNNDQVLREKTAEEWKKAHNFDFTPEMINCVSCKGIYLQRR
jgi:Fe-S-cluster-containing dehydrogenase component